ncbi:MAG: hypothetical protein LC650_00730 [Actinobacteria bacterium]|nr:hypothetical protein [Actinomycetota bacterium]
MYQLKVERCIRKYFREDKWVTVMHVISDNPAEIDDKLAEVRADIPTWPGEYRWLTADYSAFWG